MVNTAAVCSLSCVFRGRWSSCSVRYGLVVMVTAVCSLYCVQRSVDQLFGSAACVDYLRMIRQALFSSEPEPEPTRPTSGGDLRTEVVAAIVNACGEWGQSEGIVLPGLDRVRVSAGKQLR